MNESLLDVLQKVTLFNLLWAVLLISLIVAIVLTQKKKITGVLNKWRKKKNEEEDFSTLVYDLKDSFKNLATTVSQIQEKMNKQADGIDNLTDIVVKMQEKNSKTKRAEIKEKIERIYMECHPSRVCTDMAFETLKELIEEYEAHGGLNSFVHTTVEPEMYEWKKVKKIRDREVSVVENTVIQDS